MQMRTLGSTGVKVSPLCLGAMMFGAWGNPDHDESVRIIHRALDAGINFVDTADVYSAGESEEIVGKALEGSRRDGVVLATKANGRMGKDVNARGNSRRWIIRECENSLRRLRTDRIDLYQIHRPDPLADIDETLGALTDLIRSGKVCYAGSSTFLPSQIVEGQWVAQRRGRERFVCEQPPYSMPVRAAEADGPPVSRPHALGLHPPRPRRRRVRAAEHHRPAAARPLTGLSAAADLAGLLAELNVLSVISVSATDGGRSGPRDQPSRRGHRPARRRSARSVHLAAPACAGVLACVRRAPDHAHEFCPL